MLRLPRANGFRRNPSFPGSYAFEGATQLVEHMLSMPEGTAFEVQGNLDLSYASRSSWKRSEITSLPDNLTVNGYLNLSGAPIKSLPKNLTVNGYLDLSGTKITSLPPDLHVGQGLYLMNTEIMLPNNFTVNGDLSYSSIMPLPNNLTVKGNLDVTGWQIESLPKKLIVEGDLIMLGSPIESFSKDLTVRGNIIRKVRPGMEHTYG